jgi:alpha-beta hydrolase superfamily lysophospholipase
MDNQHACRAQDCDLKISEQTLRFPLGEDAMVGQLFLPETATPVPLLIVCHGAGDLKEHYFDFARHIATQGIGTFAIDMPGHGASAGPRYYVNIEAWVRAIRAALDVLQANPRIDRQRCGAFGISSSGTAVLEAALVDPRLKTLIVLSPTVRNSLPGFLSAMLKLMVGVGRVKRALTGVDLRMPLAKLVKGSHFAVDPKVHEELIAHLEAQGVYLPLPGAAEAFFVDTIKRVGQIRVPVLILWGEKDELDPPATGRMLFEALQCTKSLEIIQDSGHAGHLDKNKAEVYSRTVAWTVQHLTPSLEKHA